ncbi:sensor histidine kinase KdpD [Actinomycetospora sp. TBRC 11914]|uniref:sensor histidine kinase n=1 Tax=Actinomycetospora sp. TBRC 11914 TaxID=2729387 RepID=UPI00145F7C95|nr:HAMP domain-containing sensor histidine kinase [Actinomycetospora sp. TBRC 11914]NMO92983.1 HAMP domain-containing histidine kinase [Actinomycetospora sp. TBRC 11914]
MTVRLTRINRTRAAVRRARVTRRLVLNLITVLTLVGAALALLGLAGEPETKATPALVLLLAVLAVGGGSAAALMMVFAGRLNGDARVTWVGLAVGWYSLFGVPASTVRGFESWQDPTAAAGVVVVAAVGVVLWGLVLLAPAPPAATRLLVGLAGVVAAAAAASVVWAAVAPAVAVEVGGSRLWWVVVALAWIVGGLVVVARATVERGLGLVVVGAGLAMLGALQAGRSVAAVAEPAPTLAGLRVVALAVVLCGALRVLRRAMLLLDLEQALHEKELRSAEIRLARAAERDHDLRNGLAGLAGATAVLGGGSESGELSRVVAGELRRLECLLQGSANEVDDPDRSYAVRPAIDGLVLLRRSAGMDVRADVEPGVHAVGAPGTLAQVMTNLLSNAERHAPGSPVRIAVVQRGQRVEVRVRDFGPGIAAGREQAVLEPGTRDRRAGGLGLGLHVCRTLLSAEDATIEVLPSDPRSPGCVVVLQLKAGERAGQGNRGGECDGCRTA